jgi:enediyne biosynthesis protein E4
MPVQSAPQPTRSSSAAPERIASPGIPPLLPVLAPIVLTALVLGFVFSRYLSKLVPAREAPSVRFTNAADEAGLRFQHFNGSVNPLESPTTLGSGVAVLDYDRDGAVDVFLVNGSRWPWAEQEDSQLHHSALFKNAGDGRFVDVTARAGVGLNLQGMGAAAGDFDADGWTDLYVTGVGENRLLRNRGDGSFEDVTETSGVGEDGHTWSAGAVWFDVDEDGRLDLIVCRYARWPREIELDVAFKIAGVGRSYGAPAGFVSASPAVYRNQGNGRFIDEAERFGLRNLSPDTKLPRNGTLGVVPADVNADGALDLVFYYHAAEPTYYVRVQGGFREWSVPVERQEGASAAVAALASHSPGRVAEMPGALQILRVVNSGLPAQNPTFAKLPGKFGVAALDYDLDGRYDIFSGAARAEPDVNRFDFGDALAEAPVLHWNGGGTWSRVAVAGVDALRARGLACADFDGDGDEDVVINQNGGPAVLLRNEQRLNSAWLGVNVVGANSTGARVEIHTPRLRLVRTVLPRVGYLSQSDSRLIFGLGEDVRVRRVVVTWPNGLRQEVEPTGINRFLTVSAPR